jgi:type II secretion system protein G
MFRLQKDGRGFTLIELLIVVAIIGIIAAIAIPNLLNAIQRGKQKRTMSDVRSIGTAVESYGFAPSQTTLGNIAGTIAGLLQPTYIKLLPTVDAWKKDIQYIGGSTLGDTYTIRSYGKDRTTDSNNTQGSTNNFNNDIVYSNGQFSIWPEGTQN